MSKKFDLIVIGSGPGGGQVVTQALKKDLKIATIDYLYGGTCALRGCTPKKVMESVTERIWQAKNLEGSGYPKGDPQAIWRELVTHKRRFTELVTANTKENWREKGVTVIEGKAAFTGKKTLEVEGEKYSAKKIVIATGAKPIPLDFDGTELLLHSEDFFDLEHLPKSIIFVGGGYVAFELAHIAAAAGSHVTIISQDEKPLGLFDPDLVSQLVQSALDKGINIRLGYEVIEAQKVGNKVQVVMQNVSTKEETTQTAHCAFNTAGRVPALESLDLHKADIDYDEKGIKVNDYLQTSNEYVYAVGDVIGNYPLTPVAGLEGKVVIENIVKAETEKMNYVCVPTALYTSPKLASVGKSEQQLREEETAFQVRQGKSTDWLTEKALNNPYAGYKILLSEDGKHILGAHLLGTYADNVINIFALAIQLNMPVEQLDSVIFAYPTAVNDIQKMI